MVDVRNSPEVIADLQARAERVASAAGRGNTTRDPETRRGRRGRARVAVVTSSIEAILDQRNRSTLTGALLSGGGD